MKKKKPSTRERLLKAACIIFAEKGFRDATVAEICEKANANVAAINYHFGDKEKLYDEVWRYTFELTSKAYPIDSGLTDDTSAEDILYAFARAILHRIFDEGEAGLFSKLLYHEMASPTLALEKIADEVLRPQTVQVVKAVHKLLGENFEKGKVKRCKHSIIGQCIFYNFSRPLRERIIGLKKVSEEEIETVARHIARFSIGGIKEIGGQK